MTHPILSDRKFGLVFTAVFAMFAFIGWHFFDTVLSWAIICSWVFLALALVAPGVLLPLNRLWNFLAGRIHRIVNFTLLALFFYLLVLPFGLLMRLFGRDSMERARNPGAASYWRSVTRQTDESTLPDMF